MRSSLVFAGSFAVCAITAQSGCHKVSPEAKSRDVRSAEVLSAQSASAFIEELNSNREKISYDKGAIQYFRNRFKVVQKIFAGGDMGITTLEYLLQTGSDEYYCSMDGYGHLVDSEKGLKLLKISIYKLIRKDGNFSSGDLIGEINFD